MTVESNTSGCEFTGGVGNSNPSYTSIENCNSYTHMSGGGKRNGGKRKSGKSGKKKRSSSKRRPVTQRAKQLRNMRIKTMKKFRERDERIKKRLKYRKARKEIIRNIESGKPVSKESLDKVSPKMKHFIGEFRDISSTSSKLSSWPSIPSMNSPKEKKVSTKELKDFNEARLELKKILQKKPVYKKTSKKKPKKTNKKPKKLGKKITNPKFTPSELSFLKGIKSKSSSVLKFSDFKSKSSKKKSTKKKGHTRG